MPILGEESQMKFLSRSQRKFLLFFLKCVIMLIIISLFLFFLGFAAVVVFYFIFLSNTFSRRRCTRLLHPAASQDTPPATLLLPEVEYSAAAAGDFSRTSDCAICLNDFQEGDKCRNLENCKHLFHARCVDRWIRKKPNCPVCRTRVDLDPAGLLGSRINGGDDRWKRLWAVNFEEGTSY